MRFQPVNVNPIKLAYNPKAGWSDVLTAIAF